jgi:hypothetical protein
MRELSITESRPKSLTLSQDEANELNAIGRRMATSSQPLEVATDEDEDEDEASDKTWIRCEGVGGDVYRVTVSNAVGVIGLPTLRLSVEPKIPSHHLRYLMSWSALVGNTDVGPTAASADAQLWDLVARWFVCSTEDLLRRGLLSDYEERSDECGFARGSIQALPTARAFYQGRLVLSCDYDEFSEDSPLNRVILAGLNAIAATPVIDETLRIRALVAKAQMPGVGVLRTSDVRAQLDRRSRFYDDAFQLALHVLASTGRTFTTGSEKAWTFLVRTPWIVESALRRMLRLGMSGDCEVTKFPIPIVPTSVTLAPDLVFGSRAIGDVKYKIAKTQWNRSDLYQVTTFAVGFKVKSALLVAFSDDSTVSLGDLVVGDVHVHAVLWDCQAPDPVAARAKFVEESRAWLTSTSPQGASIS